MTISEIKDIEKPVCNYARALGYLVYKFVSPGNDGVPDRLFIKNGMIFFAEFKAPGKKLGKLQEYHSKQIEKNGIKVWVIDNKADGVEMIDHYERVLTIMRFGK